MFWLGLETGILVAFGGSAVVILSILVLAARRARTAGGRRSDLPARPPAQGKDTP